MAELQRELEQVRAPADRQTVHRGHQGGLRTAHLPMWREPQRTDLCPTPLVLRCPCRHPHHKGALPHGRAHCGIELTRHEYTNCDMCLMWFKTCFYKAQPCAQPWPACTLRHRTDPASTPSGRGRAGGRARPAASRHPAATGRPPPHILRLSDCLRTPVGLTHSGCWALLLGGLSDLLTPPRRQNSTMIQDNNVHHRAAAPPAPGQPAPAAAAAGVAAGRAGSPPPRAGPVLPSPRRSPRSGKRRSPPQDDDDDDGGGGGGNAAGAAEEEGGGGRKRRKRKKRRSSGEQAADGGGPMAAAAAAGVDRLALPDRCL